MMHGFFVDGPAPPATAIGTYQTWLVLASYIVASIGSYSALTLAGAIKASNKSLMRHFLHISGAFVFGSSIWSMHFIGMLAYKMDMPMSYDLGQTAASVLIAMLAAYAALYFARGDAISVWRLALQSVFLGAAISSMHYVGMSAIMIDADIQYKKGLFCLSIIIGMTASAAALWIFDYLTRQRQSGRNALAWRIAAALVMGVAICGMHYTGMAAAVIVPRGGIQMDTFANAEILAPATLVVTSLIFGITLITSLVYTSSNKLPIGRGYPFPLKLLVGALMATMAAIVWASASGFFIDYQLVQKIRTDIEISETSQQLAFLNTLMSRNLRVATSGSSQQWQNDYAKNIDAAFSTVKKLQTLTRDMDDPNDSRDVHDLAIIIGNDLDIVNAAEHPFLDLFREHQSEKVRAFLENPTYIESKQRYSNDIHELAQLAASVAAHTLSSLKETVFYTVYSGIIVLTLMPMAWYFAFRSISRWRDELEQARLDLLHNEKQLQRFIVEIETSQTEAMKARQTAEQARENAEKANAAKSEFLANMSHELRTPLNSILGMLRLLKDAKLSEENLSLINNALQSSTNLLDIVNDILDLSKIEAGEMKLESIGMDLSYMIDSVIITLSHAAREKRVSLVWDKNHQTFPYVLGDPTRFVRVLTNLIGNGLKYTGHGHVEIRATSRTIGSSHVEFHCEIEDTGIGIAPNKQKTIFDKFVQADTSTTRKYGGTGLGLAITKQLVELMHGNIGVRSRLGHGSTFWFTIPFETTDSLTKLKIERRETTGHGSIKATTARILVAEDHPMNQILITKLLQRFGIGLFEIAENGQEAFEKYKTSQWDIILMDCHMPELNGYDTTIAIREYEHEANSDVHVPIVAMTANAMVGDREKCITSGMDDYISKPISIEELKEVLSRWIEFPAPAAKPATSEGEAEPPVLDLSLLKNVSEGDREVEKDLAYAFILQSDQNIRILAHHRTITEHQAWHEAAHMMKGGSSGIGAKRLAKLCAEAQSFKGSAEAQNALFERISNEYSRVKEHLKGAGLVA